MIAIDQNDNGVCIVCMRRHDSLGYNPSPKQPVGRFCLECFGEGGIDAIKKVYHMPGKKMDAYEDKAIEAGSNEAGEYLDGIGKTDLSDLEKHEWLEMWRVGLVGYANEMRKMAQENRAPF